MTLLALSGLSLGCRGELEIDGEEGEMTVERKIMNAGHSVTWEMRRVDEDMRMFVTAINDYKDDAELDEYWMFYVDGELIQESVREAIVPPGGRVRAALEYRPI